MAAISAFGSKIRAGKPVAFWFGYLLDRCSTLREHCHTNLTTRRRSRLKSSGLKISHSSLTHHNATLSMSPSPTVGFGDAGAGGIGAAAAAWAA